MIKPNTIIHGDCQEWLCKVKPESVDLVYIDPPFFTQRDFGDFDDRWKSKDDYLGFMQSVLTKLHKALKPTGTILLHCDCKMSHRLRCLLDEVFTHENFINDIVWCYTQLGSSSRSFPNKHDNIFFYSKSKNYTFNPTYVPYKKSNKCSGVYKVKDMTKEQVAKIEKIDGRGKRVEDWFVDIPIVNSQAKERIGYATQKPEALLKRLIECASNPGDVVLDCFGGSGTTAAVAKKLNRGYITGDKSARAVGIMRARLGG